MSKKKKKRFKGSFYGARKAASSASANKPFSYLQKLLSSPSSDPNMKRLFDRAKYTFFGDELPYYAKSDPYEYQQALGRCLEWFVFDTQVTIESTRLSPAAHWLNRERPRLSPEDIKCYEGMLSPVFGIFEVSQVDKGRGMRVYDLQDDREYYIYEKLGTLQIARGYSLVGRIFPWEDHYTMSGVISIFPGSGFKSLLNSLAAQGRALDKFDALTWELYFKLHKPEPIDNLKNLNAFRRKLSPFLHLLTEGTLTWNQIITRIQQVEDPMSLIEQLMTEIQFFSDEERELLAKYLMALWNYVPRPSFGGESPSERAKATGEIEKRLIREMVKYVTSRIQPDDYPTTKAASEAGNALRDKWLNTPQKKLGGKTPLMTIMEERKSLGNPSRKFEIIFDIRRI